MTQTQISIYVHVRGNCSRISNYKIEIKIYKWHTQGAAERTGQFTRLGLKTVHLKPFSVRLNKTYFSDLTPQISFSHFIDHS